MTGKSYFWISAPHQSATRVASALTVDSSFPLITRLARAMMGGYSGEDRLPISSVRNASVSCIAA